jgi:hypothetical protein
MERGQVIVIAVVVSALALFGLKVWSDRTAESSLDSASQAAAERLARAGGLRGDADVRGGSDGAEGGTRAGRPGGPLRPGSGGVRGAGGGGDGRGGSGEVVRGGGTRGGGSFGYSGSGRGTGAGGDARYAGGGAGGSGDRLAPKVQQKNSLVEFLGSQPPTQSDLASPDPADGDVALKIDKPQDIDEQGGQSENIEEGQDGDGIRITDGSAVEFPNNVNPEAATFSFKIEPDWAGSDQTDNALIQLRGQNEWSNRLELVKNGEFLRFILTPDTGKEADISVRITDWQPGQQHDIRASYGNGQTSLYIDGRFAGSTPYEGTFQPPAGIPLQIGGDWQGSSYSRANSTFYNLTITNSAAHDG